MLSFDNSENNVGMLGHLCIRDRNDQIFNSTRFDPFSKNSKSVRFDSVSVCSRLSIIFNVEILNYINQVLRLQYLKIRKNSFNAQYFAFSNAIYNIGCWLILSTLVMTLSKYNAYCILVELSLYISTLAY